MQPLDAMVMFLACHEILLGKDMLPPALTTERLVSSNARLTNAKPASSFPADERHPNFLIPEL